MAKTKTVYICDHCGNEFPKWAGRCTSCGSWNTLKEIKVQPASASKAKPSLSASTSLPLPMKDVASSQEERFSSGISEFDRVLGGGIVTDSVVIISADPGMGKSTLLTQAAGHVAANGRKVLYVSGEENERQVKTRAARVMGTIPDLIWLKSETSMNRIIEYVNAIAPDLLILDSIQTVYMEEELPSRPGGAVQVMRVADELVAMAKRDKRAIFVVGQVTKSSELAGVKALEHAVDGFLHLEGDRRQQLRVLRAEKNRYGSTEEIGIFEMGERGLIPVENPLNHFTTQRKEPQVGSALTMTLEGTRPLVVEVDALVDNSFFGTPMRIAEGVAKQQLQVLTAILDKRAGVRLGNKDVYTKVTGGLRLDDPAVNLGVLMAIASSALNAALPPGLVFIGEVGLTGEIKTVAGMTRRLRELDRWQFPYAIVPAGFPKESLPFAHLGVLEAGTVADALNAVVQIVRSRGDTSARMYEGWLKTAASRNSEHSVA